MVKQAVFFDMDGVLVYSEPLHFKAWINVFLEIGLENAFKFEEMVGRSDKIFAQHMIAKYQLAEDVETLSQKKRQLFIKLIQKGMDAPVGRNAFLQTVSARYITALVSSSSRKEVEAVLRVESITEHFQYVITADDVNCVKPDPEPYLKALTDSGIKPEDAIVIEDSPSGIQAALNANIHVLGMKSELQLNQQFPDVHFFKDFNEINRCLVNETALHL